jgi:ectoine hydroxylase-related dioxygenase (phytanoyl-CoA dioxygenase family)
MGILERAKAAVGGGHGADDPVRQAFEKDGYAVLEGHLDAQTCEAIVAEAESFYARRGVSPERADRTMNFHQEAPTARRVLTDRRLLALLSDLLGNRAHFLQSIYFNTGSQQPPHSDYMYMGTDPPLQLCGIWIACEDVTPDSGPLVYYPGSHLLPSETVAERYDRRIPDLRRRLTEQRAELEDRYANRQAMTNESLPVCLLFDEWTTEVHSRLEQGGYERTTFLAKRGDLLIWHANLVHGGSPVARPGATRRSLVAHYLTRSVRRYFDMNYVDTQAHLTLRAIDRDRPAELHVRG